MLIATSLCHNLIIYMIAYFIFSTIVAQGLEFVNCSHMHRSSGFEALQESTSRCIPNAELISFLWLSKVFATETFAERGHNRIFTYYSFDLAQPYSFRENFEGHACRPEDPQIYHIFKLQVLRVNCMSYQLEPISGLAFTKSPNRKGLGKRYNGLEKFDESSPILCCISGQ